MQAAKNEPPAKGVSAKKTAFQRQITMRSFKITESEYLEIKKLENEITDEKIRRRLRVLTLRYEGARDRQIAELCGLHRNSVSRMCLRYEREGLAEYIRNKYTSHCRLLSEEAEREILSAFSARTRAGLEVTAHEIKAVLDEACGKDTGNVYTYNLLKRHRWQKVMPKQRMSLADGRFTEAAEGSRRMSWMPPDADDLEA